MLGIEHAVVDGAADAKRIFFPHHRRLVAERDRDARQQPAEHAVADDAFGLDRAGGGDRMIRGAQAGSAGLLPTKTARDHLKARYADFHTGGTFPGRDLPDDLLDPDPVETGLYNGYRCQPTIALNRLRFFVSMEL